MPASPEKQTLTEKGASPQILIPTYNETATDALGRTLVTYKEAGFPKKDKYVGLFYLIWTDSSEGFTSNIDVTKAYASDPENPYLGIPRSLLGLTEDVFTLNFHWMDNVTDVYDRHSWFTTGDSAPERRNDYTLTLSIPYDATEETIFPARAEGAVAYMPAVSLSPAEEARLQAGLRATLYTLPERYGKMPNFGRIAANARETTSVSEISPAPTGDRSRDFALLFEGYVRIPADGSYAFPLKADDCARLYVDGRLAAEIMPSPADEAHKLVNGGRGLRLAEGYHALRLEYAEIGGGCPSLTLAGEWSFYRLP